MIADKGYEGVNVFTGHDLKKRFGIENTVYGNRVIDVAISGRYSYFHDSCIGFVVFLFV